MKVFSSQWSLQFKQLQINPKTKFRDFNGIRNYGLYVSQLSYEDPYIGSRPICWVHLEWSNEDDVNCGNTNFKWRYDHRIGNLQFKQLQINPKKKIRIQQSPLQYSALFAVRQSRVDMITFKIIS